MLSDALVGRERQVGPRHPHARGQQELELDAVRKLALFKLESPRPVDVDSAAIQIPMRRPSHHDDLAGSVSFGEEPYREHAPSVCVQSING